MFGLFTCGWLELMTSENERLVADSCDESAEGSIGLSGEVKRVDRGQEEFVAECLTPVL